MQVFDNDVLYEIVKLSYNLIMIEHKENCGSLSDVVRKHSP